MSRLLMLTSALTMSAVVSPAYPQAPMGWRATGESAEFRVDSSTYRSGRASALVQVSDANGLASLRQGLQPEAYLGKRVRLSGYVKSQGVEDGARLWMRVDGQGVEETLSFDNMTGRLITGTTDWTRYEIVLDVPAGSSYLIFGLLVHGKGRAWLDDVTLEVVGPEVASTNMEQALKEMADHGHQLTEEQKQQILQSRKAARKQPVNLGFEEGK